MWKIIPYKNLRVKTDADKNMHWGYLMPTMNLKKEPSLKIPGCKPAGAGGIFAKLKSSHRGKPIITGYNRTQTNIHTVIKQSVEAGITSNILGGAGEGT